MLPFRMLLCILEDCGRPSTNVSYARKSRKRKRRRNPTNNAIILTSRIPEVVASEVEVEVRTEARAAEVLIEDEDDLLDQAVTMTTRNEGHASLRKNVNIARKISFATTAVTPAI
jgi:hypothetical protein